MARGDSSMYWRNRLSVVRHSAFNVSLDCASLSLIAVGIYGAVGPFWAIPCEFLTGFSAASGIALITSIANFGGFVGPYAVGLIQQRTGNCKVAWSWWGLRCWYLRRSCYSCRKREMLTVTDKSFRQEET